MTDRGDGGCLDDAVDRAFDRHRLQPLGSLDQLLFLLIDLARCCHLLLSVVGDEGLDGLQAFTRGRNDRALRLRPLTDLLGKRCLLTLPRPQYEVRNNRSCFSYINVVLSKRLHDI
ncbi:hypothetical protein HFO60_11670 [Rhizobium leguminosarum]|nr:hypothetical protein [Rhizobium leguminosarum]